MTLNVEIGGSFQRNGWINLENRIKDFNIITDDLPFDDGTVDQFYMSHVIEHIPIICSFHVVKKIYDKLKIGGKYRIVCPDLEVITRAYIDKDVSIFNNPEYQLGTVPKEYMMLGPGGCFMAQINTSSPTNDDNDSYLYSKRFDGKLIAVFSHISGWDFEMLHNILKNTGFSHIERTGLEDVDVHRTLGQLCVNAYK